MTTTAVHKKSSVEEAFGLAPHHLQRVLGSPEIADRFLIVALNQVRKVPQLASCTKESILDGLVRMARLGLDPAIPNEAWLVPYNREATLLVGYGGLRKLVLRSPDVQDVFAQVVCQNDTYEPAESPVVLPTHRLPRAFQPRGRAIGYYAAALLHCGLWRVVSMSRAEVAAHRDRYSAGAKSTFWADNHPDKEGFTNFDKMAMKTCLRQLCSPRYLSLDADVAQAVEAEEALYRPVPATAARLESPPATPLTIEHRQQNVVELFGEGDGAMATAGTPRPQLPTDEEDGPQVLARLLTARQGDVEAWYVWAERKYRTPRTAFTVADWDDLLQTVRREGGQEASRAVTETRSGKKAATVPAAPATALDAQKGPKTDAAEEGTFVDPETGEILTPGYGMGASWAPENSNLVVEDEASEHDHD